MSGAWLDVERLFREAVEMPVEARSRYLDEACVQDDATRRKVKALLEAHDRMSDQDSGFLETLDPDRAAELLGVDAVAPSAPVAAAAGDAVGRYRIVRVLGRGGAGVVYLAHDPELDRPVALKVLPPLLPPVSQARGHEPAGADHPGADRLLDEARAASALDHPHIGTVYEVGRTDDGWRFIAMACYEEGSLRERLRAGPLSPERALVLARQVAEGLAAAHARGIVHRDLKPENLVFDRRGAIKLVDFGLAIGRDGARLDRQADGARGGGQPALRGGTLAYMSPEQEGSGAADTRADVWAFGLVVHEMLVGRLPRPEEASELRLPEGTAPELAALLVRCLDPDPERRPASGEALVEALVRDRGTRERMGARRRIAFLALAAGVLVIGAFGFGTLLARGTPRVLEAEGSAAGSFPERGWVLVADFDAADGAQDLAMAAREALAVDLQQSEFVRVMSRAQVAGVLTRMNLAADVVLDLPLAMEVAERFGAGAVLGTTISRAGPDYVLSGRALDPRTGAEFFAVRTAARERRLLGAVERLSREMRGRLGEDPAALARSLPLPEVTTRSIEALRLYAEAEREIWLDYDRAAALLAAAVEADSTFAMAHRLAAAAASSRLRFDETKRHIGLAYRYRDRLPERERWHVEAIHHINVSLEPRQAVGAYEMLVSRYPDDARAWNNIGVVRQGWLDDDEGAFVAFERAIELDPGNFGMLGNAIVAAYIVGRSDHADSLAAVADSLGLPNGSLRWQVARAFAEGDARATIAGCDLLLQAAEVPVSTADDSEVCGSMDVAGGRIDEGVARLERARDAYLGDGRYRNATHVAQALTMARVLQGDHATAARQLEWIIEHVPAERLQEPDLLITRLNLRVQAQLLGYTSIAERVALSYPPFPDREHWFSRMGEALVEAAAAVRAGDGAGALAALDRPDIPPYRPIGWRIWDELIRGLASEQIGDLEAAAHHLAAAADPRFLTLPFATKDRIHLPVAIDALARVKEAQGDSAAAANARDRLDAMWEFAEAGLDAGAGLSGGPG